ncbi:T9SS type A sorting domain-containing protein [uncultured Hymenobacter sp.]|uniref:T9SS type A sorting domain-containing protein n=1 Tax=uncultured Hymenobacter sp. TaxID=170016 RepID=UPI0035CA48C0
MKKIYPFQLRKLATIAALSLFGTVAQAQLATYTFTGATGSEATFPVEAQPVNVLFSSMSRGTGVTASAGANTFAATNWTASNFDANDYFAFSVQPSVGFRMRLDSLVLDERRSNTGIRDWAIRSSLDNFTATIIAVNVADDDQTRANKKITLPASFAALTAPVEFRIYGYNAEAAGGSWRVDNVRTYGVVTAIPLATRNAGKNGAVSVFPNPATDVLSIRANDENIKTSVTVVDLTGRTILHGTTTADGTFNLRGLPTGSYIVTVDDGAGRSIHRVIKR